MEIRSAPGFAIRRLRAAAISSATSVASSRRLGLGIAQRLAQYVGVLIKDRLKATGHAVFKCPSPVWLGAVLSAD